MLPFTYEMFDAYGRYKTNKEVADRRFEYNYAIGQLTDESTKGDYEEVNYLKGALHDTINANFTEYEQKLIDAYIHRVVHNVTKDRKTMGMKMSRKRCERFVNEDDNLRIGFEEMMKQSLEVDERKKVVDVLADYQRML